MRKQLIVLSVMLSLTGYSMAADRIVCTVNGEVITEKELQEFKQVLKFRISMERKDPQAAQQAFLEAEKQALDTLIEDRLLLTAARKNPYQIPDSMVTERLKEYRDRFKSEAEFEQSLVAQGIGIQELKEKIREQILVKAVVNDEVRSKITISPQEITAFYEQHIHEFTQDESVSYAAFVFDSSTTADAVYLQLHARPVFDELARTYKDNLKKGNVMRNEASTALQPLFSENDRDVFEPIYIDGKYYVFVIEKRTSGHVTELKDAHEQIYGRLFEEKFTDRFQKWVDQLKKDALIQYKDGAQTGAS
jgi:peptidyl-prolyl cis-trans isomerase SurA